MKTVEIRRLNEMQHYGVLTNDIKVDWDTDFSGRYVCAEVAERLLAALKEIEGSYHATTCTYEPSSDRYQCDCHINIARKAIRQAEEG
jgi:hypothetical protein